MVGSPVRPARTRNRAGRDHRRPVCHARAERSPPRRGCSRRNCAGVVRQDTTQKTKVRVENRVVAGISLSLHTAPAQKVLKILHLTAPAEPATASFVPVSRTLIQPAQIYFYSAERYASDSPCCDPTDWTGPSSSPSSSLPAMRRAGATSMDVCLPCSSGKYSSEPGEMRADSLTPFGVDAQHID